LRRLFLVAFGTLAADLATKFLVVRLLPLHSPTVNILGDLLRLAHVKNHGSAFGLIQGGRLFFIVFSLFSIALVATLARLPRYRTPAFGFSLGMILGGALGNLVDRVAFGPVTDFIDMGIGTHRWPTYNVADIGITAGVLLLAVLLLRQPDPVEAREPDDEDVGRGGNDAR
jgi:signal peptidase II